MAGPAGWRRAERRRGGVGRDGAVRGGHRRGPHGGDRPPGGASLDRRRPRGQPRPRPAADPAAARLPAVGRPRQLPGRALPAQPVGAALAAPRLRAVGRAVRGGHRRLLELVVRTGRGDPRRSGRRAPRRAARRPVLAPLHRRPVRARPAQRRRGGQEAQAARRSAIRAGHRRRARLVLGAAVPPLSAPDRDRARPAGQRGDRPRDHRRGRPVGPGQAPRRGRDHG